MDGRKTRLSPCRKQKNGFYFLSFVFLVSTGRDTDNKSHKLTNFLTKLAEMYGLPPRTSLHALNEWKLVTLLRREVKFICRDWQK